VSLRERLIAAGHIRPQKAEKAGRPLREAMIADGRIAVPNPEGAENRTYLECYWASMARWYYKPNRRWESPRLKNGVWQ
jgi:hypothetical protein